MEMDKKLILAMAKRPTQNNQQKAFPNHDQTLYLYLHGNVSIHVHRTVNLLSYIDLASF